MNTKPDNQSGTIHIVGAGLAGLSAAVHLAKAGRKIVLYEAGNHAGGRCRSYLDKDLGLQIDNGNHLLLTCNHAVLDYLDKINALATLHIAEKAEFPFMDIQTGQRWLLAINEETFPKWIFNKKARVPNTYWWDYLVALKFMVANRWKKVSQLVDTESYIYKRLIAPLCVSILNTQPQDASAKLLGNVLEEAFAQGGHGCHPVLPLKGLSESLIDPALAFLTSQDGIIHFGSRLRGVSLINDEVHTLHFVGRDVTLTGDDWVVLAVPPWVAVEILPHVPTPTEFRSIVNAHFKTEYSKTPHGITSVVGGVAEWIFEKDNILSTTTSAAESILDKPAEELARLLWADVARVYGLDIKIIPPYRIVKEKRATFAATPEQIIRRPVIESRHKNLVICGDWTQTNLPSTIEGAVRSGRMAAQTIVPPQVL